MSLAISTHTSIISKIKTNKQHSKCSIEIVSDFNIDLHKFQEHEKTNDYLETLFSFGLLPVITKPTRISPSTSTLIDHIFVSNQSRLHNAGIILTHLSDHYPIFYIDQTSSPRPRPKPFKTRKINQETQSNFNNLLKNTSFVNISNQTDPERAFSDFFNICNSATEVSFPEITVFPKQSRLCHSPWMSTGLLISSKTKQKLFSKKTKFPTEPNISKFKTFNNIFNMCKRKAQQNHYSKLFLESKEDLKSTWKLIREVTCSRKVQRDSLPEYFRYQGNIVTSPQDIANNFNKYFSEVGPNLAPKIPS